MAAAPSVAAKKAPHISSLDGLRALAVAAVMLYHAGFPLGVFGWIGVDLFFVLSGFLITNLMVREYRLTDTVSLPRFWGRRFLRLMPAYWVFVGIITACVLLGVGAMTPIHGWTTPWWLASLWGYFSNFQPYEHVWTYERISSPLWSLAVEEQFYFIWPFICLAALKMKRPKLAGWLMVGVILVFRFHLRDNDYLMHTRLWTRGLGIVLGCAVALTLGFGLPPWAGRLARSRGFRGAVVLACVAMFVAGTYVFYRTHDEDQVRIAHAIFTPLADVLFVCLVAMLWHGPPDWLARGLSIAPLAFIGRISYGIYLYHEIFRWLVWETWKPATDHLPRLIRMPVRFACYYGLTLLLAAASFYIIERPFLKIKDRLR